MLPFLITLAKYVVFKVSQVCYDTLSLPFYSCRDIERKEKKLKYVKKLTLPPFLETLAKYTVLKASQFCCNTFSLYLFTIAKLHTATKYIKKVYKTNLASLTWDFSVVLKASQVCYNTLSLSSYWFILGKNKNK